MNDSISRSALLEQECVMDDDNGFRCSVVLSTDVRRSPAVDAEKVFEAAGLVKEAFEMAKANLRPVRPVRHGRWVDNHCTECGEMPMGTEMWDLLDIEPPRFEWFMDYCPCCGAKMDAASDLSEIKALADPPIDSDLEHMTRFAMQQAINKK